MLQYTWPINDPDVTAATSTDTTVSPLDRPVEVVTKAHLGRGIIRPFRRDEKNDFANETGEKLVRSCVGQVLGTRSASPVSQGELPWRTEFGSQLFRLRLQHNDTALEELARVYVAGSLRRWEPRVLLKDVQTERLSEGGNTDDTFKLTAKYDIIKRNVPGNQVTAANVAQTETF